MRTTWGNCSYPATNACEDEDVEQCCTQRMYPYAQKSKRHSPCKRKGPFVCNACKDTHLVTVTDEVGDSRQQMCIRCPVPCQRCRAGGNGPYCETTPCTCECHKPIETDEDAIRAVAAAPYRLKQ